MGTSLLLLAVIAASTVEMVEAITIVVAVGVTNGWRPALRGAAAALATLAVVVVALGPALVNLVPIEVLRVVVGTLLLIMGLQWLRKAVLRASGYKAQRDEAAIFQRQVSQLRETSATAQSRMNMTAFVISYKGVFLEGLEVVMIVISMGASSGRLGVASLGAAVAVVGVTAVGLAASKPLSRVPENALKMAVALLLISFGTFWAGEGVGVEWPGADLFILALLAVYACIAFACVGLLRRTRRVALEGAGQP